MRISFLALVFVCQFAFGQSIPELRATLDSENDSTRVASMGRLASIYARSNTDSAFYFGRRALELAIKAGLESGKASAYNALGNIHVFQSNYDSAQYYWGECLSISKELGDTLKIGAMLNNIGMSYTYQTKYDESLEMLFEARRIRWLIDDPKITSTVNNIGNAYQRMEDWEKALEYYQEAAELKEKYEQTLSLSNTLNNIGIVLKQMGKPQEAIPYYEKSLKIAEDYNDKNKQSYAHNNLAALYHLSPDLYGLAEDHYRKSIALKKEMGDQAGLFNSYTQLADLLSSLGKTNEAKGMILQAEKLGEEIGQNLFTSSFLEIKARILLRSGQKDQAFETLTEAYKLKTEEMALDRNEKISELEAEFEKEKQSAEIERLSLETDLQRTQLQSARTLLILGGGSAALIIVLLIAFYYQRVKKSKAEKEAQDLQVEALTKRIIDLNAAPPELVLDHDDLNGKIHTPLTEREYETLRLSLDGKTNSEIGEELFISTSTVKFHLRNTYGKLGVNNRKEALDYVVKTS